MSTVLQLQLECENIFGIPLDTDPSLEYCNATHDSFSCWPAAVVGSVMEVSCPNLIATDATKNATRPCYDNGTWGQAAYSNCFIKHEECKSKSQPSVRIIYNVGYSITIVALFIALTIFVYFRSLRCLRNTIHCHLIVAFFCNNISWMILYNTITGVYNHEHGWLCRMVVAATNYFMSVPFFWMFVEGLYLYTTVVWAFSLQKVRLWYYVLIGWGSPLVFTIIWIVVRLKYQDSGCWMPMPGEYDYFYDYVLYAPIILILLCNVFFIVDIVYVLVTKLRASNTLETRRSRKAVRATFVLLPLLGLTFILFITPPPVNNSIVVAVYDHVSAVMHSLQGLFVAVIYCFMNGEVKTVMRKKFRLIQESRSLSRYTTKSSIFSSPGHRSSGFGMQQLALSSQQSSKCISGDKRTSSTSGGGNDRYCRGTEEPISEACTTTYVTTESIT